MELESKRVEIVKSKSQKEELMAKLGQVKLVLDFMQSTILATKKNLKKSLQLKIMLILIKKNYKG